MSRADSGLRILAASARIQDSVADILESKADEMETLRHWVNHLVHADRFEDAENLVAQTCSFHEQMVECINGITRIETGLARHLEVLILEEESGVAGFLGPWVDTGGMG